MAPVAIYTSRGEVGAFMEYPHLFSPTGEWIGFVTPKREVYSVLGVYVGYITNEPRILRKRSTSALKPHLAAPPPPPKTYLPATVPLAPLMSELTHSIIDVLLDEPERLHTLDVGELREDLD